MIDDWEFVQRRLAKDRALRRLPTVATGSKVNYEWIKLAARGGFVDPGYFKVKKLKHYYAKRDAASKARSKRSEATKRRVA